MDQVLTVEHREYIANLAAIAYNLIFHQNDSILQSRYICTCFGISVLILFPPLDFSCDSARRSHFFDISGPCAAL